MRRGPTTGEAITLRLDTIERQAKALTRTQAAALRRIRDHGPCTWCKGLGRAGGAVSRMFDRLALLGLATVPPHEITKHGRNVLDAYDAR